MATFQSCSIELEDRLRFARPVRSALCNLKVLKALVKGPGDAQHQARVINDLCAAARLSVSDQAMRRVESLILERLRKLDFKGIDWAEFEPDINDRHLSKGILLKPHLGAREKGVVFISFDNQWVKLMVLPELAEFAKRYTLVLSPTWSPPHALVNYVFPRIYGGKLFCLISNVRDLIFFPRISAKYRMVPLLASNWVDPNLYQLVSSGQKEIDIFMLANFGKYKRHHALFKALQEMPASMRILLIGQRNGKRTSRALLAEAAAYGVQGRFELKENASNEEVNRALVRAKTSLILSRREGSCVAVVESMFANTPVAMYEDAEIGSRKFINPATGRFLKHAKLAAQLMDFVQSAGNYQPRKWVMENGVSCISSTEILNAELKQSALAEGQDWTQDIVMHHWRPDPLYYDPADEVRLRAAREDLEKQFGIRLG